MTIDEFSKLLPYDMVYDKRTKVLEKVLVIDIIKKMILIESGLYTFSELETEEYYIVNVEGINVVKHAELVLIDAKINELLDSELTDDVLKSLDSLSKLKMEYHQDLNLI